MDSAPGEKQRQGYDNEMATAELRNDVFNERDVVVADVFVEKDDHQIHYKTLSWQVSFRILNYTLGAVD